MGFCIGMLVASGIAGWLRLERDRKQLPPPPIELHTALEYPEVREDGYVPHVVYVNNFLRPFTQLAYYNEELKSWMNADTDSYLPPPEIWYYDPTGAR
jgi:hypothetical protein